MLMHFLKVPLNGSIQMEMAWEIIPTCSHLIPKLNTIRTVMELPMLMTPSREMQTWILGLI